MLEEEGDVDEDLDSEFREKYFTSSSRSSIKLLVFRMDFASNSIVYEHMSDAEQKRLSQFFLKSHDILQPTRRAYRQSGESEWVTPSFKIKGRKIKLYWF